MKVYLGGQRENEEWAIRVDPGAYSPWLGETYNNFARIGLSFQRSQNSGRLQLSRGPQYGYYKRVGLDRDFAATRRRASSTGSTPPSPACSRRSDGPAPAGADALLQTIDREVTNAVAAFSLTNPSATVPALARGLKATREALALLGGGEPDATFILKIKERQFEAAITAALGVDFKAMAQPAGVPEATGPFAEFAPPPTMAAPVPGQTFEVRAFFTNRSPVEVTMRGISLATGSGWQSSPTGARARDVAQEQQHRDPALLGLARERRVALLEAVLHPARHPAVAL